MWKEDFRGVLEMGWFGVNVVWVGKIELVYFGRRFKICFERGIEEGLWKGVRIVVVFWVVVIFGELVFKRMYGFSIVMFEL